MYKGATQVDFDASVREAADKVETERELIDLSLRRLIPGYVNFEYGTSTQDKNGIDVFACKYALVDASGRRDIIRQAVDVKMQGKFYDYIVVEPWSVPPDKYDWCRAGVVGWTRDPKKLTDFILYVWPDRVCSQGYHFPVMRQTYIDHFEEWRRYKFNDNRTETRRGNRVWRSQWQGIPREVFDAAYDENLKKLSRVMDFTGFYTAEISALIIGSRKDGAIVELDGDKLLIGGECTDAARRRLTQYKPFVIKFLKEERSARDAELRRLEVERKAAMNPTLF